MRVPKNPMTPLAAVVAGVLAGAAGTVCLDAVHYLKYRRSGGADSPLAWEFAPVVLLLTLIVFAPVKTGVPALRPGQSRHRDPGARKPLARW